MSGKLCFPWSGRVQDEVVARGCEAELRGGAFPSGAWERGAVNGSGVPGQRFVEARAELQIV